MIPPPPDAAPRARIHLTGTGGWGIVTCLALAAAAANTANNLLYLLLALLMSAYAVSAWSSRRALLKLTGDMVAPAEIRPGCPAEVVATVRTESARSPGVVLELQAAEPFTQRLLPQARRAIPAVTRGADSSVLLPAELKRRGPGRVSLLARSPFPFGLVEGMRRLAEQDVLVLPVPDPSWRRAISPSAQEGQARPRKGEGSEIFNIRDHASGEDARRMDWKATARLGRPMIREYAEEVQRAVALVVPVVERAADGSASEASERAISRAAGAAEELGAEGWKLRLIAPGTDVRGDARAVLAALARLQPGDAPPKDWWRGRVLPGETALELGGEPA